MHPVPESILSPSLLVSSTVNCADVYNGSWIEAGAMTNWHLSDRGLDIVLIAEDASLV